MKIEIISFDKIKVVASRNPRMDFGNIDELSRSIQESGLKQPIGVQKCDNGTYHLVDGERRYQALSILKSKGHSIADIPAIIYDQDLLESEILYSIIISNDGKPFLPIEESQSFKRLHDAGESFANIASRTGRSLTYVHDRLALIGASTELMDAVNKKNIPISLATDVAKVAKGDKVLEKELLDEFEEDKKALKRKLYGFRLPAAQKQVAQDIQSVMSSNGYTLSDLVIDDDERNSVLYLTAALEVLANVNKGSVSDVLKFIDK